MAHYRMKVGYGPHQMRDGTNVVPGDTVECTEDDIKGVLNKFELIGAPDPLPAAELSLFALERDSGNWDVINPATGKAINNKPLDKSAAEAIVGKIVVTAPEPVTEPEPTSGNMEPVTVAIESPITVTTDNEAATATHGRKLDPIAAAVKRGAEKVVKPFDPDTADAKALKNFIKGHDGWREETFDKVADDDAGTESLRELARTLITDKADDATG